MSDTIWFLLTDLVNLGWTFRCIAAFVVVGIAFEALMYWSERTLL
jgi:hypothetical protein